MITWARRMGAIEEEASPEGVRDGEGRGYRMAKPMDLMRIRVRGKVVE